MFFYPVSNYLEKLCRIYFVDNTSKEGYLTKSISDEFKYKLIYKDINKQPALVLFNELDIANILSIHSLSKEE